MISLLHESDTAGAALGWMQHEEYDRADTDLTRAIELLPGCARFRVTRGQVREYQGRHAAAIDDYKQAIKIDPQRDEAHYYLAYLRASCEAQEFRDAKEAQEHARIVQTLPDFSEEVKRELLAAADAEAGDWNSAIKYQTEALRIVPADGKALASDRLKMYQRHEPYHRQPGWWR